MSSEIAQIKQQIEAEYAAAVRGLTELAYGTSRHTFITQKMESMERNRERLVALVGEEQASVIFVETLAML